MVLNQYSNVLQEKTTHKNRLSQQKDNKDLQQSADKLDNEIIKNARKFYHKYQSDLDDLEIMSKADILSDNPHSQSELQKLNRAVQQIKDSSVENQKDVFKLDLDGHDLMQLGLKGQDIGKAKKYIENLVIEGS